MLKSSPVASATVACVTRLPPDSTFGVRGLLPRSCFGSAFSRAVCRANAEMMKPPAGFEPRLRRERAQTAWNLWLNAVSILSYCGIQIATMLSYMFGPSSAWMTNSKWVRGGVTLLVLGGLMLIALIGLSLGKRVLDFGGIVMVVVFGALIALPIRNHLISRPMQHAPFSLSAFSYCAASTCVQSSGPQRVPY